MLLPLWLDLESDVVEGMAAGSFAAIADASGEFDGEAVGSGGGGGFRPVFFPPRPALILGSGRAMFRIAASARGEVVSVLLRDCRELAEWALATRDADLAADLLSLLEELPEVEREPEVEELLALALMRAAS